MKTKKSLAWLLLIASIMLLAGLCAAQAEGAQISGKVWVEKDVDGLMVSGESGLTYVRVTLEQRLQDGSIVQLASQDTGRDGLFAFSVAQAGEYRLHVKLIDDYQFTIHGLDSAALPAQGNISFTPFFQVEDGQLLEKNIGTTRSTTYISIYAFEDANTNGGRMQSEPKIRNVLTELVYDYEGETYVIASAKTDRDGEASLRDLSAGTYRLRVTLPDNYMIGPIGQKVSAFYNCVLASEGQVGYTEPFTIPPKGSQGLGIGAVRTGSLTGSIWQDDNADGTWNAQEPGMTQATISLHSDSLGLTREAAVNENGEFSFIHIQPGDYDLTISLPEGMIFTRPGQSLITEIAREHTIRVNVQPESTITLGAIGAMESTSLSLFFYEDALLVNGRPDSGEAPLEGVGVSIFQEGQTVAYAVTDVSGTVIFPSLRSGEISISATLPGGMVFAASEEGVFQVKEALTQAQSVLYINQDTEESLFSAGAVAPASISGVLFEDHANRGVYQNIFARLPGFAVQAVDQEGRVCAQTATDVNGQYTLSPLMPGEYTVRFLLADPYVASPYDNSAPENNAIINQTPEYGETNALVLAPGEKKETLNAGVFRAGIVDGYILLDQAVTATADQVDGGLPGVTVTLLDAYGAPFSEYSYGISDENGYYFIKGVLPGTYSLRYTMPDNGAFTMPLTDDAEIESDGFVITSGSEIRMPNLGAIQTSTISGSILHGSLPVSAQVSLTSHGYGVTYETSAWEDGHYNLAGLRPDIYTLTVTLADDAGYIISDGENSPVEAVASSTARAEIRVEMGVDQQNVNIYAALPASIQGLIYYDGNASGLQEQGEYGAEYRAFSIWRGDKKVADVAAGADGGFSLSNLIPGEYTARITLNDSEIIVGQALRMGNDWQVPFTVEDGAILQPVNIPMLRYGSITGQIWSLDGSMNGVSNIAVSLLDIQGNVLATALSNAQGSFSFGNLMPGIYALSASLPEGYVFAREQDLSYRSSNIYSLADGSVHTVAFELPMGANLIGLDIGVGAMGAIGDYAWLDENGNGMQDIGESPMPGIAIELYQRGQLIASTTTDEYGFYSLANLYPGEYQMKVTMHQELKATKRQTTFPLVASILPESSDTTVTVESIIVPSGGRTLHYDLGFQLRKNNVYPDAMDLIPTKDWRPYTER